MRCCGSRARSGTGIGDGREVGARKTEDENMIELRGDTLTFSFPEVHEHARGGLVLSAHSAHSGR